MLGGRGLKCCSTTSAAFSRMRPSQLSELMHSHATTWSFLIRKAAMVWKHARVNATVIQSVDVVGAVGLNWLCLDALRRLMVQQLSASCTPLDKLLAK